MARTEERRVRAGEALRPSRRAALGQFFTPSRAASLISRKPRLPSAGTFRVLDPGAGVGSLTAALVARALREAPELHLEVVAVELDPTVAAHLEDTLADCREVACSLGTQITATAITGDLIAETTGFGRMFGPLTGAFDLVIMNPPYRKLGLRTPERDALAADGVDCPNLYCTFLAIGALLLRPSGQLVAITPRSFANGPYFGAFRQFFLGQMTLDRLHVFESRSTVFADSDVLQENIVFSATRRGVRGAVTLSVSHSHTDEASHRIVAYSDIIRPSDKNKVIHIPAAEGDADVTEKFTRLPCGLSDLQLEVSTGKVVDFRARDYLIDDPTHRSVPLIYPGNLREGRVQWPLAIRKAQAIVSCPETQKLLLPTGRYVLVKRFSAKEEPRRVVAVVYNPEDISATQVGFENHLNVFHYRGHGLGEHLSRGLCLWLNSSAVDTFFRTFSGHTQVNATDLRSLRYPAREQLLRLSEAVGHAAWPDQEKIDSLVARHVFEQEDLI
jgi:adenine-specific DNA-methyltransferase